MNEDNEDVFEEELFPSVRVKELEDEDFLLNTGERLVLKASGCSLVLFYSNQNEISRGLKAIWNSLADQLAGINFYAVNTSRRYDIMRAYEQVRNLPDHPFNKFTSTRRPFIWVFREALSDGLSIPKAIYNGELSTAAIRDWALMLACEPGYEETNDPSQGGMDATDNVYIDAEDDGGYVAPVSSTEFATRDYDNERVAVDEALRDLEENQEFAADDYIVPRPLPSTNFNKYGNRRRDPGFLGGFNDYQLS